MLKATRSKCIDRYSSNVLIISDKYAPDMERNKLKIPPIKLTKGDRRRNEDLQEETDLLSRSYPTMKLNIRKNDTNLGMLLPPLQNPELTNLK